MSVAWLILGCVLVQHASCIFLSGYLCPTCPSATDPNSLIANMNKYYNRVNIAFIGWDANGNILNQFDDPSKNFQLTKSQVENLQSNGHEVYISIGGGAGNVLDCSQNSNTNFINTFTNGILNYTTQYGFDGVDFDIEHRQGDYVECAYLINGVMNTLSSNGLSISMAPQMTNLYPEYNQISSGFNELAPLVNMTSPSILNWIQPQMYNTWSAVETVSYAEQYTQELDEGYTCSESSQSFYVQVNPKYILLGYPSSPSGASSGYINPTNLVTLYNDLNSSGYTINGIMTWSIGWDEQNNYNFANTLGPA